jgi:hypothetical protein
VPNGKVVNEWVRTDRASARLGQSLLPRPKLSELTIVCVLNPKRFQKGKKKKKKKKKNPDTVNIPGGICIDDRIET